MAQSPWEGKGTVLTFVSSGYAAEIIDEISGPEQSVGVIDVTHFGTSTWAQKIFSTLKNLGEITVRCHYDPALSVPLGTNQQITLVMADAGATTLTLWGALTNFNPNIPMVEGKATADITITPSNRNGSGTETAPTWA